MKMYYVVKKQVEGKEGFFFYENKPKRLPVHCTYDDKEFTELVCSFDSYGCYIKRTANKLLSRKYYITFEGSQMVMKKHITAKEKPINVQALQKEMGRLFLPH